ncbi:hypothetical protein LEMLEM_LOCUS7156, partial [Lemmus lemmus]
DPKEIDDFRCRRRRRQRRHVWGQALGGRPSVAAETSRKVSLSSRGSGSTSNRKATSVARLWPTSKDGCLRESIGSRT